jgi:D-3-phosphoglycerate dehydrogenase
VVDEAALLQALQEGWIAGAALDVLEHEPPRPGHPLLKLDQVVITPHIAGYSDAFWAEFWSHSIRTLVAMAEKRRPLWVVNPEVQPRWAADH